MHRIVSPGVLCLLVCICCSSAVAQVSLANQNVTTVSGPVWTTGDPFLQRQIEPSMAVSTRNNLHLPASNSDYRTVDLPGLLGIEERGDAWLGIFKSFDGGLTWEQHVADGFTHQFVGCGQSFAVGTPGRAGPVESSESSPISGSRWLL
jgi:hypothetical protein